MTFTAIDDNGSGASVSETLFIDVQPAQIVFDSFQQDSGIQGIVSIEAENNDANNPASPHSWTSNATSGFSGNGAMQATPNTGVGLTGEAPDASPEVGVTFNF